MQIIISPTKKMIVNTNDFDIQGMPIYLDQSRDILAKMQKLSYVNAKKLWQCSDKIAQLNYDWLQQMSLDDQLTPAILSYKGIQYQYMAPDIFTADALAYVQRNLRILSGFYGILRPFDGVVPYRLEMQAKISVNRSKNLYSFWNNQLYSALDFSHGPIINLASQEYSKAITTYMNPADQMVTIVFASEVNGQLKTKATLAKMARGAMVRYLAENNVTDINDIKKFDHPDWHYDDSLSSADQLVFIYNK